MNKSKLLWFITTLLNVDTLDPEQKTYNFLYVWSLSPQKTFRELCEFLNYTPCQIRPMLRYLIRIFPNLYISISFRSPLRKFFKLAHTPFEKIDNVLLKEFMINYHTDMMQLEASGNSKRIILLKKRLKQRYFDEYLNLGLYKHLFNKSKFVMDIMDLSLYEILDFLNPDALHTEYDTLVNEALSYLDLMYVDDKRKLLISKLLLKALGSENIKKLIQLLNNYYSKPLIDENNNIFFLDD